MDNQLLEVGILSILLKNPELVGECSVKVKPYMFSSTPNRNLYYTMISISESNLYPDVNLVMTTLSSSGQLSSCGGESYLQYLINQNFDKDNLEEFIKMLINSYKAREIVKFSTKIPERLSSPSDVDDVITSMRGFLDDLGSGAESGIVSFTDALKESWDTLVKRVQSENKIAIGTGFKDLDYVTGGFMPGDLWVIAGRPGMGKSALMCNSILQGYPTLVFSREMSRDSLVQRLISITSGVPVFNLRLGNLNKEQLDRVSDSIKKIKDLPIYIDTNFDSSVEYVTNTTKKFHSQYGIQVVHIDYLQLLVDRDEGATHEIGRVTRSCKLLSNHLGITEVVYSQLNRSVESRNDKRPLLSDLRQSGNIEEDVDTALFLYRDVQYNPDTKDKDAMELIIRKQRQGPVGTVMVRFDDVTNRVN